ncbi:disease resistance protein RPV1-like [Mangifera indica]|uniref:disease resistance protein RPV1-like n=1 Tax=Mangifera indica TaxID=29780 RepID=UPI001CFA87EA|nr:disease resistance protein RPV1-like [Mangifera indica]
MATSSSSSVSSTNLQAKHHVFLNFRGPDSRHSFTSHLHEALRQKKIITFIDDKLMPGDEISPSLLNEIEGSKIAITIFSKDYASSKWCLEELVKIIECKNIHGQIVIPVFYHVCPSEVRNQTGSFGDGFAKLEERFKEQPEMVQRWKTALSQAANISGCFLNDNTSEAEIVKKIVDNILRSLRNIISPSTNKNLVGVESAMEELIKLLLNKDVCSLGIWGIGGIGKTTIARAVFNKSSNDFEGFYFAENIREESGNPNGLIHLREKLLSTILGDQNPNMGRLGAMKTLIVFDDVTNFQQIEDLIEDYEDLGSGSRVIITTRDKQVLEKGKVNKIYEVKKLSYLEDLHLFSQYAFKQNLIPEDYLKLSNRVVNYSQGLPLSLKVLGSSLFNKSIQVWESTISKLEETPPLIVYKVLKVSFEGLDEEEQDIFLDIACFFRWKDKDMVMKVLNACDLKAERAISDLIDKSLIAISSDNIITMHDLLQEMGRKIVREEKDIGKRSRLCHHKDLYHVLTKNTGIEIVRGICMDMFQIGEVHLNPLAFSNMHSLKFLKVCGAVNNKVHEFQDLEFDFLELRYICWNNYWWKSLPRNFNPKNLVALEMRYSNLKELWSRVQPLINLKYIDLSYSKHLRKIAELSQASNLESLILEGCTSLIEIIFPSSRKLNNLVTLNLRNCKSLQGLPPGILQSNSLRFVNLSDGILKLKSLKYLSLSGCSNVKTIPKISWQELVHSLPRVLSGLSFLKKLNLNECNIIELPNSLGDLSSLKDLNLSGNNFNSIPTTIINLSKLSSLNLSHCNMLQSLPNLPGNIKLLVADSCKSLQALSGLPIPSQGYFNGNLSFINCFNLDWRMLTNILDYALSNMYEKTYYTHKSPTRYMCFRGSEIPDWFNVQSTASFLELPEGSLSHNFIGFTFCTVLSFQDYKAGTLVVEWEMLLKSKDGLKTMGSGGFLAWTKEYAPSNVEFDYVFLGYDVQVDDKSEWDGFSEAIIKFRVTDYHRSPLDDCVVKKCGVRLLLSQEESMNESGLCWLCDEEDEEDEPQSKRSKLLESF